MPVSEPFLKRISRTFFEEGLHEALNEAIANPQNPDSNKLIGAIAKYMIMVLEASKKVQIFFRPHLRDQGVVSIAKFSQTR